jgi:hypothetical protein
MGAVDDVGGHTFNEESRQAGQSNADAILTTAEVAAGGAGLAKAGARKATRKGVKEFTESQTDDVARGVGSRVDDAVGTSGTKNARTFRDKLDDVQRNPDRWERVSAHTEKAQRKGARRHGSSTQEIYQDKDTGETIVRHTVTDDSGKVVDDHFRPNFKPRTDE